MSKKPSTSRRTFVKGTAATAAIAPFFIGRSAKAADVMKVKMATVAPRDSAWGHIASRVTKLMEKNSEGALDAQVFFGGAAGGEIEMLKATKDGYCHAWAGSCGALASIAPEMAACELPYLFGSGKAAFKALSANRTMIHDLLMDKGFKLVMFAENGYQGIGTNKRVETPSDLKGLKIRTQESKVHIDTMSAFGASAVPMGVTEVLSSLQTGVVDGFGQTPVFTFAAGWQAGVSHWVVSDHIYQPAVVVFSRKGFWDKLPSELQQALDLESEDVMKIEKRGFRSLWNLRNQLKQNFIDMGLEVTEPDLGPWRKLAGGVHDKFKKRTTKQGVALLDALKKAT
jgi:TRAP-type C4-dicarboxylate transport system substrate-binding protein